jgi:hypothetical protein
MAPRSGGDRLRPLRFWVTCRTVPRSYIKWLTGIALLVTVGCLAAGGQAAQAARPSFAAGASDVLDPEFAWSGSQYVARCDGDGLTLDFTIPKGWTVSANGSGLSGTGPEQTFPVAAGEPVRIVIRERSTGKRHRSLVRCLPDDFPPFDFSRFRSGGPRLFMVQTAYNYAAIFGPDGVPVWWTKASGNPNNAQVRPDGKLMWDPVDGSSLDTGDYQVFSLTARAIRTISSPTGDELDVHDIQYLPNGHLVVGTQTFVDDVDTTSYGGVADSRIRNMNIQELTKGGKLVRSWNSEDHIGLDETPQFWWDYLTSGASTTYDVSHWNAVELDGRYMYLSFRHLDAIYKVDRFTGKIVWKLGGTETPKSLRVVGDSEEYPLRGQHDVRLLKDGTLTVFDNRSYLVGGPRGVSFRINDDRGTARVVGEIRDPILDGAFCCGSFRKVGDDYLIGWGLHGADNYVGAYRSDSKPIYRLHFPLGFTYRANPVPPGSVSVDQLSEAMDRVAAAGRAG